MDFSPALAYRFKKDFKLPFPIESNETFFNYYLELFEERLHCKLDWEYVNAMIEHYGTIDEFFNRYNTIKDTAINAIKTSEMYEDFISSSIPEIPHNIPTGDVYKDCNVGKLYLSIDLKNANFQAFKQRGVITNSSYKDFIWSVGKAAGMTDDIMLFNYMAESKYTRQVIFGNCNPKRTIAWEKYYIYKIYEYLTNLGFFENWTIVSMNSDEFIFEIPYGEYFDLVHAHHVETLVEKEFGIIIKANSFSFEAVKMVAQNSGKTITTAYLVNEWGFEKFKCLPETFAPLFEEWLKNLKKTGKIMLNHFNELSRQIIHDGLICEINEKIYITI